MPPKIAHLPRRARTLLATAKTRAAEYRWRRRYTAFPLDGLDLISFDVFDTLITRTWREPSDLFLAVGYRLRAAQLFAGTPAEWTSIRRSAEDRARQRNGVNEVSLEDIYEFVKSDLGWTSENVAQAIRIELDQELKNIRPIAPAHARFAALQSAGRRVVVTSDTYFIHAQLSGLLAQSGYMITKESIFASATHGVTKDSGQLFRLLMDTHQLQPHQVGHLGDNPWADGRSPAKLGLQSAIVADYLPNRYEREFARGPSADRYILAALSGCARTARLRRALPDSRHQAIWNTGANVAGPLLFGYVLWVLSRAKDKGLRRIYFLARDGEILLLIAKAICAWLQWDIDCRYLYASRQSFAFPSLYTLDAKALAWIFAEPQISTIRSILKRVEMTPLDVSAELAAHGIAKADIDQVISAANIAKLKEILQSENVRSRIEALAQARRATAVDYLRQEGFFEAVPFAICDVGWRGAIQRAMQQLMPAGAPTLHGFYFGLSKTDLLIPRGAAAAYTDIDISDCAWLIETFCMALHGSVKGFERGTDNRAVPLLGQPDAEDERWGAGVQREAILAFVTDFTDTLDPRNIRLSDLERLLQQKSFAAMHDFLERPAADEADAYGSLGFATDPTHDMKLDIAPQLAGATLLSWLILRQRSRTPWINWPQASIARYAGLPAARGLFRLVHRARLFTIRLRARMKTRPLSCSAAL
jgi:predicted HAD superfamily hydrolase